MSDLPVLSRPLILASSSPRRKDLLEKAGFRIKVCPIDVDESYPDDLSVEEVAIYLAKKKAKRAQNTIDDPGIIITADSIVILDQTIFGKPKDRAEAREMLSKLSGKEHLVITGVCLISGAKVRVFQSATTVTLAELTWEEIDHYIERWQPFDKAGAYGIQDWIGWCKVMSIQGSYANVMGLPVAEVYKVIAEDFLDLGRDSGNSLQLD